jgi:hypothetical protein
MVQQGSANPGPLAKSDPKTVLVNQEIFRFVFL